MKSLNSKGQEHIQNISQRYGISQDAVQSMLSAVVNGGGTMAQFNISELGGGGQWMRGGMTMVGDMFNNGLKNMVNNLCQELSNLIAAEDIFLQTETQHNTGGGFTHSGNWWPSELGSPSSSGAQNNFRYAFFPAPVARLAIDNNGTVSVYNTLNHHISGVSQQQGNGSSVVFSSQFGYVDTLNLPLVSGPGSKPAHTNSYKEEVAAPQHNVSNTDHKTDDADIFNKIDRLAELFNKGVLTADEFNNKKSELLKRL